MSYAKDFSIIVPIWRGAIKFLPKLIDSIPNIKGIEIIIVDNSEEPIKRGEIDCDREIVLLHSEPERHAGGSRNDGLKIAKGKWILFADADDYYTDCAFDKFYSCLNSTADIIYTKPVGIYEDTGEYSDRGEFYANLVCGYINGKIDEKLLRFEHHVPWCKMIKHSFIDRYKLKFDEIRAGNDRYFSLVSGYYAKEIKAINEITYIVTVNKGSLTQHYDYDVIKSRLYAKLHCNKFLKEHGLFDFQSSIMYYLYESRKFGFLKVWELLKMIIEFKQNPFIGWKNWRKTMFNVRKRKIHDKKYIVK